MFTQPTQIPRSPLASTLTLAVHLCVLLLVVALSAIPRMLPTVVDRQSLVYVTAVPLSPLEFSMPAPTPPPEPAPPLEVPAPEEPPKVAEAPVIEKPRPITPPAPKPERPKPIEPRTAPPPVPEPPRVVVGAFNDAPVRERTPDRPLEIADAGFSADAAEADRKRREVSAVEGFDSAVSPRARADRPALVADAGFGAAAAPGARRAVAAVDEAGFATDAAPNAPAARPREVARAGFADPAATRTAPAAAPPRPAAPAGFAQTPPEPRRVVAAPRPQPADKPVEILYKPSPAYTEDARARGIEGEVSIEVEFTAAGQVRVLRIVRGLGYGLDEMARRAAEQIRFRPATSRGVPVDFRATLTILFRLT